MFAVPTVNLGNRYKSEQCRYKLMQELDIFRLSSGHIHKKTEMEVIHQPLTLIPTLTLFF